MSEDISNGSLGGKCGHLSVPLVTCHSTQLTVEDGHWKRRRVGWLRAGWVHMVKGVQLWPVTRGTGEEWAQVRGGHRGERREGGSLRNGLFVNEREQCGDGAADPPP